jgi:2-amino-4-hydroxy-6-hydroxymethyldihydropteridine diphosphokinase
MPEVFIGVGSNVDREANIRGAIQALSAIFGVVHYSPVYRTEAIGFAGDDFYNLVMSFVTERDLDEVATVLRQIEAQHGRHREEAKFAPRTLDLDLLLYGDTVGTYGKVVLPRPDILEYAFVIRPLADLAPEHRHPLLQRTYAELWRARADPSPPVKVDNFLADTHTVLDAIRDERN